MDSIHAPAALFVLIFFSMLIISLSALLFMLELTQSLNLLIICISYPSNTDCFSFEPNKDFF